MDWDKVRHSPHSKEPVDVRSEVRTYLEQAPAFVKTYPRILSGTGSPETLVIAEVGTLYVNRSGGAGTTLYVKESGTSNTGWIGK